jgi:hypothetical protein
MRETEGQTDTLPAEEIEFKSNHLKQPLWLRKHQDGKSQKKNPNPPKMSLRMHANIHRYAGNLF